MKEIMDKFGVPEHLQGGIHRWIESGVVPGQFLQAVIRNDLFDAVARADDVSLGGLRTITLFFYNEAPGGCWGSPMKMREWIATHEKKRVEAGKQEE